MKNGRTIIIALAVIIVILTVYTAISGASSFNKIKSLTVDLEHNADSLEQLHVRYDSVTRNYDNLYNELEMTKKQLVHFKTSMDSIMALRIKNVSTLTRALGVVIEEQDSIAKIDSTNTNFILK